MKFENDLRAQPDPIAALRSGLIGAGRTIVTPQGTKKLIYADYVASGRALRQVEDFVMSEVLPYYANSHTEQSYCGARMTHMREQARRIIAEKCGATTAEHAVIFGGAGATTGLNQLVHLFGIKAALRAGQHVFVLTGPYEHHSNLLPWRESGAEVIELPEAPDGGVDLDALAQRLKTLSRKGMVIGSFSAASNVTGVCTDPAPITALFNAHGARIIWDYAGGGPYLPISMQPGGAMADAIVLSPHKFIGGPAASGVLIVRRAAAISTTPSRPGGGTVSFVNAERHDYVTRLEQREEGGTPNVIGDIRAALALIVKDVIGQERISKINQKLCKRAFDAWHDHPQIGLLAPRQRLRLPIFSFAPRTQNGRPLNYKAFTTALSDHYGIQARGGCSCAGPYVHRLLHINSAQSALLRREILLGNDSNKPGFVRFNLSYLMDDATVDAILTAVPALIAQLEAGDPVENLGISCGHHQHST
ncbi:aminotransferase class V-fold PLP-dependent enzyme [Cognatishimia sp. SS12]|nr:aminotransferase class V-fold PLP-dependent enzyme [Cognatishimia sp. SS12]